MDDLKITRMERYGELNPPRYEHIPRKTPHEIMVERWNLGLCTCEFGFCPNHQTKESESA